jgi:hypothetical protein
LILITFGFSAREKTRQRLYKRFAEMIAKKYGYAKMQDSTPGIYYFEKI